MPVGHGMSRRQVDEAKARPGYVSCRVVKAFGGSSDLLFWFPRVGREASDVRPGATRSPLLLGAI